MKRFLLSATLALAAVAGLVVLRGREKAARDRQAPPPPVSVVTAAAVRRDVPIYLDGIGTVQALNTVSIRPMVDGPLVEVRFREGQDVRAGEVLARIDPRTYQATYDQAVAKKAQDEANLANARLDLARYQRLARTAYTTEQQADTQRATVAQLEAQLRQDQAQIDSARTNLGYTTITAPVDGRTGIRQVDLGNIVHSSDTTPLTVVTTIRPIFVTFTLPQQTLPDVAAAMAAGAPEVMALPQGEAAEVLDRGRLTVLDNQVDQNTGTIKLKALFSNAALRLWPGAFVTVRLALRTERGVTAVPTEAVQRGPLGAYVFVLRPDGTVTRRAVRVPHQDEQVAVIGDGLQPGEVVVTDGASRLTEGTRVRRADPPPAQAETPAAADAG
jgi:multidrug efflux system membrane fusion protein